MTAHQSAPVSASANAAQFHRLHHDGLLVLANAWDAGSARLIESLGAPAIATTSAAVCWAHGYPDGGDFLPVDLLVSTVKSIARVVRVPLTVDVEGGYSDDPAKVAETIARVIDAGGVGVNLEDGGGAPDLLAAKIEQAKAAGARLGVDLFVNARTDVYLRGLVTPDRAVEETLARGERYRAAGADGLFVPGIADDAEIRAVVAGVALPLNVMARPGVGDAAALRALGVRRLSAGASIGLGALAHVAALATAFLRTGTFADIVDTPLTYPGTNEIMIAD